MNSSVNSKQTVCLELKVQQENGRGRKIAKRQNWPGMLNQVTTQFELAVYEKLLRVKDRRSHGQLYGLK